MISGSLTSAFRRLPPEHRRFLWLGLFMAAVIFGSLKIGEHYPFSHYPMYGNPGPHAVDYYFLTDASGEPLPVIRRTGDTAPKLKKRLNTSINEWAAAHPEVPKAKMPPEVRSRIAQEILDSFVAQSKRRGTPLPERVQLWRGEIRPSPEGYRETFAVEAAN